MRDTLRALAAGEIDVEEAEARLAGYATTEAGRFDTARESRRGLPEAILAEGKEPDAVAEFAAAAVKATGRAIVTRAPAAHRTAVQDAIGDGRLEEFRNARIVVARSDEFERPELDATVAIVTAGTSDAPVADEAMVFAREMGASVDRIDDVGVAGIHRLLDHLESLRAADVVVVAAGREGALPTVVAGLVPAPVIGLPVSTGYGYGGTGKAALLGMLQSCAMLSVVNIDAGVVAGAQAGLIARALDAAR